MNPPPPAPGSVAQPANPASPPKRPLEPDANSSDPTKRQKIGNGQATPVVQPSAGSSASINGYGSQPVNATAPQTHPAPAHASAQSPPGAVATATSLHANTAAPPAAMPSARPATASASPAPSAVQSAAAAEDDTFLEDPETYVKGLLLPTLDHTARSILEFTTRCSVKQLLEISDNPSSHSRRALDHLHTIFLRMREKFLTSGKYLDVAAADRYASRLSVDEARRAFSNTNLASAIFVLLMPTYYNLKDLQYRLGLVFDPLNKFLRASNMELVAGLLTQVHLAQLRECNYRRVPAQDEPLAQAVEASLVNSITDNETFRNAFWQRCQLLRHNLTTTSLATLLASDCRGRFLRDLRQYLRGHLDPAVAAAAEAAQLASAPAPLPEQPNGHDMVAESFGGEAFGADGAADDTGDGDDDFDITSSVLNAARLAQSFMNPTPKPSEPALSKPAEAAQPAPSAPSTEPAPYAPPAPTTEAAGNNVPAQAATNDAPANPPTTASPFAEELAKQAATDTDQNAPTSEQYERARLAAAAKAREKASASAAANLSTSRRPWTHAEETALMQGLDHVKGPHWSQILAMYGPGGSVNEVLKDRNQVQLKDKARNLKLFFLKTGYQVPPYLQHVTGDLKTRAAPARPQKNEDGVQMGSSEDKATNEASADATAADWDVDESGVGDRSSPVDISDDLRRELEAAVNLEAGRQNTAQAQQPT